MEKILLTELVQKIRESSTISTASIPDMDLYMDQLLTFLNQRLEASGAKPDAQTFTKTMINNYTKDGLLLPPKNKKYSRQHILLLILIHNLKGILSISDIKRLFEPILRDTATSDDDLLPLEDIYSTYLDLTETYLTEFSGHFTKNLSFISDKTKNLEGEENVAAAKLFLSVLVLIAQANLSKKMAELIIDSYFSSPAAGESIPRIAYDIDLDTLFGQPPKDPE